MADSGRGGFGRGFGGRGDGDRGRGRGRGRGGRGRGKKEEEEKWTPCTKLGRLVQQVLQDMRKQKSSSSQKKQDISQLQCDINTIQLVE